MLTADEIVFVEGGRVVEQGPLNDLLAQDSRFAAMFRHEFLAEEPAA